MTHDEQSHSGADTHDTDHQHEDRGHEHGDDDHGHHHHGDDDHHHDHHHAHDVASLSAAVVTVSTSRTIDDDAAGDAIAAAFDDSGHDVTVRDVVADDFDGVQSTVDRLVDRDDVDVLVTTGGTGVTPDDVTVEAVGDLFQKDLPGFGELFRRRSESEIGTRVVGTRARAGIVQGVPVFCLPGSENAARLGSEEIIVPEAPHLAGLATREEEEEEAEQEEAEGEDETEAADEDEDAQDAS
ncbi:molybdenum cofactor synthesis domain-containing protein [Halobellus sp. H-GB7]|mgnify:FL=1|uniref:MogA/MoaB family molybdenum cofactor biosynthesis protein n=1 Tax=Halobellus sp. H-GB7 TaxID=3069756 RepID=UPI0027B0852E|nr:molybdenum cofactor synthesis domain-containing protein [Halobellus sp. H-GB7]MDQ2055081.1 molybdopterin-binding protein [Halobellus sp. H-GB7]